MPDQLNFNVVSLVVIIGLMFTILNLMITGLGVAICVKFYTEYMKDKSMDARKASPRPPQESQ